MKLLIKFPTRGRPGIFFNVLQEYIRLAETSPSILVTVDTDDRLMATPDAVGLLRMYAKRHGIVVGTGLSKSKVEAINRDMELAAPMAWDVCLLASDDMIPLGKGYDRIILEDAAKLMPDLDGVLWYPDGRRTDLCTLAVIGRSWFERKGYIYHPGFESLWCDDYMQWDASREGRLHKRDRILIHHAWQDLTGCDPLHRKNSSPAVFDRDRATFERLTAGAEAA